MRTKIHHFPQFWRTFAPQTGRKVPFRSSLRSFLTTKHTLHVDVPYSYRRFMTIRIRIFIAFLLLLQLSACKENRSVSTGIFSNKDTQGKDELYDLPQILESGTLIALTLNGPDTYYEYKGKGFGTEFMLAEAFASHIGAKLQIETDVDTLALLKRLENGEGDFIALKMGDDNTWQTREQTPLLAQAISEWWEKGTQLRNAIKTRKNTVKRKPQPPMLDRKRGVISRWDEHFLRHARNIGWDWKLMAAQCYQESAFDPHAVSWVGAQGLMQIMPATAEQMGLKGDEVFEPQKNLAAAAKYILALQGKFKDIPEGKDKICFVLAAYNGGTLHVRDAMALTQQNGGDPSRWSDVAPYILHLAEPSYYNNPLVKHGYMRGSETVNYVQQILERWEGYKEIRRSAKWTPGGKK